MALVHTSKRDLVVILKNALNITQLNIHPLAGDAGTRKYYRIKSPRRSDVLMDMGQPLDPEADEFVLIGKYMDRMGVQVPKISWMNPEKGLILLNDLGDMTLQSCYIENPDLTLETLYPKVMSMLLTIHRSRETWELTCPAFGRRFDFDKFMAELRFFKVHFLERFKGLTLNQTESDILERGFVALSERLACEPMVFTHRDFHSRNLMVTGNTLTVIDFQDARLGLPEYDLASIVRDAYVELPEEYIQMFIDEYYDRASFVTTHDRQRDILSLMCIQRNLKALGTFGYQDAVKNNNEYIQYTPVLCRHLAREFTRISESARRTKDSFKTVLIMYQLLKTWLPDIQISL